MAQRSATLLASSEADVQLAISSIKSYQIKSNRRAATIFSVSERTIRRRRAGVPARRDCQPNSKKLTELEEQVIIRHILDLDTRGFAPTYAAVRDMADKLLAARNGGRVGVNWPSTFVKRTDSLTTRFNRSYDRQRALCEDSVLIRSWFELVEQTKAKYGICDEDVYNFDEAGFMIGKITTQLVVTGSERRGRPKSIQPGNREWVTAIAAINAAGWSYEEAEIPRDWAIAVSDNGWTNNELGVEWLKHFNAHTKTRVVSARRLLVLDGHESHHSLEFQELCKENNIYTLCMPPHSSHLLQPLDVGCFSPLKRAYSREVESLIRHHINHITKLEFLPAFKAAFDRAFTPSNICSAFRGAGLVPLQPDAVLSKLDVQLRTPSPAAALLEAPWEARTPSNVRELEAQSTLIRKRVRQHKSSSPASIIKAIDQLKKGAEVMILSAELMRDRITSLERANEAASARKQRKKKRIQKRGTLTKGEGEDILAQREVEQQISREERQGGARSGLSRQAFARCTRCRETGHNSRTCKKDT
ncbi:hypothetical protein AA0121_g12629 [Alternaria tenuissima]|nr:hypothetical protein AA0121_g12629 [Alternaria tenuissima]